MTRKAHLTDHVWIWFSLIKEWGTEESPPSGSVFLGSRNIVSVLFWKWDLHYWLLQMLHNKICKRTWILSGSFFHGPKGPAILSSHHPQTTFVAVPRANTKSSGLPQHSHPSYDNHHITKKLDKICSFRAGGHGLHNTTVRTNIHSFFWSKMQGEKGRHLQSTLKRKHYVRPWLF